MADGTIGEGTVAVIAAAAAALGGLVTKAGEAGYKLYRARKTDEEKGHALIIKEWQKLIDSHQAKILRAEERIETLQKEHVSCLQENAVLKSRVADLEGEVAVIKARLDDAGGSRGEDPGG